MWLKIFQMVSLSTHGDLFNCSIKRRYSTTTPNYTFSDSVCLTIIFFGADRGISPFCTLSLPAEHLQFLSCSLSCPVLLRTPAGHMCHRFIYPSYSHRQVVFRQSGNIWTTASHNWVATGITSKLTGTMWCMSADTYWSWHGHQENEIKFSALILINCVISVRALFITLLWEWLLKV